MQPKNYLDQLVGQGKVIRLAHVDDDEFCRAHAIILNQKLRIAVMVEDCGDPELTGIRAGDIVQFEQQPEAEACIVGESARIS